MSIPLPTEESIDPTKVAFDAGTDAIESAKKAAAALEIARATDSASLLARIEENLNNQNKQNMKTIKSAVAEIVGDALGREPTRYFDASRLPLICKSILEMHLQIKLIMWILGVIGSAFIVGLVGKFLKVI